MITAPNAANSFGNSSTMSASNPPTAPKAGPTYGNPLHPPTPTSHPDPYCCCTPSPSGSDGKPSTPLHSSSARENGVHALRHFYASTLLDTGETITALVAYLGHSDPAFTLRVYTHLMPSGEERTRRAVDGVFGPASLSTDGMTA